MNLVQYIILMFGVFVIGLLMNNEKDSLKEKRKKQSLLITKESVMKSRIDEILTEKVKPSYRKKKELEIQQAGLDYSFVELVIYSVISAAILGVVMSFVFKGIFLGLVFAVVGFTIPNAVISAVRGRRLSILDKQVGTFMRVLTKRYESIGVFQDALKSTAEELRNEKPISVEANKTLIDLEITGDVVGSIKRLSERTDNKFLRRFANYYKAVSNEGNKKDRVALLERAYNQYERDRQLTRKNKKETSEQVRNLRIFMAAIPMVAISQMIKDPTYWPFMTTDPLGKKGTAFIVLTLLLVGWLIDKKIAAPLD